MDGKKKRITVKVNHKDEGFFTDNVTVFHNPTKFVIDFSQTVPRFDNINGKIQQTFTINHKTVIMDPNFAKILLKTLEKNVKNYEKNFGAIKIKKKRQKKYSSPEPESTTRYIG
jgi:hypothetical protein